VSSSSPAALALHRRGRLPIRSGGPWRDLHREGVRERQRIGDRERVRLPGRQGRAHLI